MAEEHGTYLYCVIKEKKPRTFDIPGQDGKKVYSISEGNISMVVSDSETKEYSFIREHLLCHQRVIEEVMRKGYDVLPVRFGTVARSAQNVREKILQAKKKELEDALKIVEGRIELGLRAMWKDMPGIFQEIVAENPEIQRAKQEAQQSKNQFKIARVGEMVVMALGKKRDAEAQKILEPLLQLADDAKERQRIGDSMVVSYAFLVAKKNQEEFDKQVRAICSKCEKRTECKYVGPIPPFNFVELTLDVL